MQHKDRLRQLSEWMAGIGATGSRRTGKQGNGFSPARANAQAAGTAEHSVDNGAFLRHGEGARRAYRQAAPAQHATLGIYFESGDPA